MKASLIKHVKGVDELSNIIEVKSLRHLVADFYEDIEKFKRGEKT